MKKNILILFSLIILFSSACTTMETVNLSDAQSDSMLTVGQKVHIVTTAGAKHTFTVSEITSTKIVGQNIEIPINEISSLQTKQFSVGKTSALVLVSLAVSALIVKSATEDLTESIIDAL